MRALDQSRNVDHDEGFVVGNADDAELRFEGREWIVGDLGMGCRDHGEQGRFSCVWNADDAAIRQKAQFQP